MFGTLQTLGAPGLDFQTLDFQTLDFQTWDTMNLNRLCPQGGPNQ
jgi:hypothetical protein